MTKEELIVLPRHEPKRHERMGRLERASQFSPFSALSGYSDAIADAERVTEERILLSDDEKSEIDIELKSIHKGQTITVSYFEKDARKVGGKVETVSGTYLRIDEEKRQLLLFRKPPIALSDIIRIKHQS